MFQVLEEPPTGRDRELRSLRGRQEQIREFLISRRARVTPEQAGLPTFGDLRRVPGLRREEVALLAGVSADYYTRLERGNAAGVSDAVLDALARALQLNDIERAHLFHLVRAARPSTPRRKRGAAQRIRPSVQRMLDAMTGIPAFVRNDRLDILAANRIGRAFYSQHFDSAYQPVNSARFAFLDPRAQSFYLDWDGVAKAMVAVLHEAAGRDPYDRDLETAAGPSDRFTGAIYIDTVVTRSDTSRLGASVHLTPSARTAGTCLRTDPIFHCCRSGPALSGGLAPVVIKEGVTCEVRRIGTSAVSEGRVHRAAEVVDRA